MAGKGLGTALEVTLEGAVSGGGTAYSVCPWETVVPDKPGTESSVSVSVCPWDDSDIKPPAKIDASNSSSSKLKQFSKSTHGAMEITELSERMMRSCGLRQITLGSDFHSTKRLAPVVTEQRRASVMTPRLSDLQVWLQANPPIGGAMPLATAGLCLSSSLENVSHTLLPTILEEEEEEGSELCLRVTPVVVASPPAIVDQPSWSSERVSQRRLSIIYEKDEERSESAPASTCQQPNIAEDYHPGRSTWINQAVRATRSFKCAVAGNWSRKKA